jgi:carboxyl-terminal processing protease
VGIDGNERRGGRGNAAGRRSGRAPQILALIAAILIAFAGGMVVDHVAVSASQPAASPAASPQEPLQDFQIYEQALQIIRQYYVGRSSITDQQLLYGSISGMVDSLGDTNHSRFLTPQEYQEMTSQLSGQVAGIGILISEATNVPVVERVIAGSPAEHGGIKAGDQITAVNGTSTTGLTFDELAALIRGNPGTKVAVSVIHAGSTTSVTITMTRAVVTAPLVDWGIVPGTHIADIALYEFDTGAADQVQQAIDGAIAKGARGIVLDLRSNPGGYADEAVDVASEFLSSGVVYIEEDASGKQTDETVDTSRFTTALPLVVVVDNGTASAAEIVAGALQDSHRAKVVGLTTVGTGTVLQPFKLSDGSVVLLGVEDWLTPSGHRIFGKGITPDQTVALPVGAQPIDPINLSGMTAAKVKSSGDAELLAALKNLGS